MVSMELIKVIHAERDRKVEAWRRQHIPGATSRRARINKPHAER